MSELKTSVETLAKEQGKSELDIITKLQAGAAIIGNEPLLDELCELKDFYIDLLSFPGDVDEYELQFV